MKKQVGLEDKWKIGEVCCVLLHFDVKMMSACRPFFLLCFKDNLIKKLTIICPILLKISLAIQRGIFLIFATWFSVSSSQKNPLRKLKSTHSNIFYSIPTQLSHELFPSFQLHNPNCKLMKL